MANAIHFFLLREKNKVFYEEESNNARPLLFFLSKEVCMRSSKLESGFQDRLIKELKSSLHGCFIFKMEKQGVPDLLVLYKNMWAFLECKRNLNAHRQPNQEWYINTFDNMSFAKFICPENRKEVLDELYKTFGINR